MIRPAVAQDAGALGALDRRSFSFEHSPVAPRDAPFDTEGVLLSEVEGAIAGYTKLGRLWPIPSVEHVRELKALAVDAAFRRRGIARALLDAAIAEARAQGARKLTLRVLGHNAAARALYTAHGFEVEGVLRDLFVLEGRFVDDVLMSLELAPKAPVRSRVG